MTNFNFLDSFSDHPDQARKKFITAAKAAGLAVFSYPHPDPSGPQGETIYTDVAWEGCAASPLVDITTTGTHGIEGLAGSAILTHRLRARPALLPDTLRLYVHALNAHGFAWERRADENNVDLNRNFIDWDKPPPEDHPLTAKINDLLRSRKGKWPMLKVAGFLFRHGMPVAKAALSRGQYTDSNGLFHGGMKQAWSNILWHNIINDYTRGADHIVHVDIHTGLGPYGHGEIIVPEDSTHPAYQRAKALWGDVTSPLNGTSASSRTTGDMSRAFKKAASQASVTSIALEFGTVAPLTVLKALTADNAVHLLGLENTAQGQKARRLMRKAFYPDDDLWRERVLKRGTQVLTQAHEGLQRLTYP